MSVLSAANVRTIREWTEGALTGKRRKVRMVEVYGVTVGSLANNMPATAFGLTSIEETSLGYHLGTGGAMAVTPHPDGDKAVLFAAVNNSTAPADAALSTTPNGLYFTIKGY